MSHKIDYDTRINRLYKHGRGQGHGVNYIPWLDPFDFSCEGREHLDFLTRTSGNRKHIFFSDLEQMIFYLYDFDLNVIDIREQFPLIDRDLTMVIAEELNIKHPMYPNNIPKVMTTDFLIDYQKDGVEHKAVRTVKYCKDLENQRVLELFSIEQEYFLRKYGIEDWKIVTERDIDTVYGKNLSILYPCMELKDNSFFYSYLPSEIEEMKEFFLKAYQRDGLIDNGFFESIEDEFCLPEGAARILYKNLIVNHAIEVDLSKPLS